MPNHQSTLWPPLHTAFSLALKVWAEKDASGLTPFISCSYRTGEEQNRLYAQGRTAPGHKVTNAKAGQSLHNYPLAFAFDIAFRKPNGALDWSHAPFERFAAIMRDVAPWIEWGGEWERFKDRPHFEVRGYHWTDARSNRMPDFR